MDIKSYIGISVVCIGLFVLGILVGRNTAESKESRSLLKNEVVQKPVNVAKPGNKTAKVVIAQPLDLSDPTEETNLGSALLGALTVAQFEEMALEAASSLESIENDDLLRVLISEWAKKDSRGATLFAQEQKRNDLLYECLRQMGKQNPEDALSWLEKNAKNSGQVHYLSLAVYEGMAKLNPADAVASVEQMPTGVLRSQLLSSLLNQWAKQDVHAAFDWIENAELTPQLNDIYAQVMNRYIEQNPFEAAALIDEMESGENRLQFSANLAYKLAERDIDYALGWVSDLQGDERRYAMQSIVDSWASGPDALNALNYVLDNMDHPYYDELLLTVAVKMPLENSTALTDALDGMQEPHQIVVAEQLASYYLTNDQSKYDNWIESLDPGIVRDTAIQIALNTYRNSNMSKAFSLSESISDKVTRETQIRKVMQAWVPLDQYSAEQALANSNTLSSAEKNELLDQAYQSLQSYDYLLPAKR